MPDLSESVQPLASSSAMQQDVAQATTLAPEQQTQRSDMQVSFVQLSLYSNQHCGCNESDASISTMLMHCRVLLSKPLLVKLVLRKLLPFSVALQSQLTCQHCQLLTRMLQA